MNVPKSLIVHHTAGPAEQTFEIINSYHKQKFNLRSSLGFYIGYQYFIDKLGKVTQGRADTDEGAHTIGMNNSSIGICLAGNFDLNMPTPKQVESLRELLKVLCAKYSIAPVNIFPHRKFTQKTCYGLKLPDSWGRDLVVNDNLMQQLSLYQKVVELLKKLLK